jgi:uncharacterized membrane protein
MRVDLEASLERWVEAEILDRAQADRIRQFESAAVPGRRSRWPTIVALAFGGAMLAAGVLLFVSAHWDALSPLERMALLVGAVGGLHAAGAFASERFHALGVTLHAVGTIALGGAIALAGQIFHMQEHWPSAVLMWALGATVGWALLRDWPHLAMAAVLWPWWLAGEWLETRPPSYAGEPVVACGVLLLAITYLSVRRPGADRNPARIALMWIGGLALLPATLALAVIGRPYRAPSAPRDAAVEAFGLAAAMLLPLVVAFVCRRRTVWMNGVAAAWVLALYAVVEARADVLVYAVCAAGAAGMVVWGIHEVRPERINLGMAGFAVTLIVFFFSSVMDQLGRSAALISLGILCVGGGWYGERLRRRLIAQVTEGDPQ